MIINKNSKISAILRESPKVIDALAAINPHFSKLRNPLLRKLLASRVTIADAARIGNCETEEIFEALRSIGFTVEDLPVEENRGSGIPNLSILSAIESGNLVSMDVRPILESGKDPFNQIIQRLNGLPAGMSLELINTFEPTPLIHLLAKKGFDTLVQQNSGLVYTYFMKQKNAPSPSAGAIENIYRLEPDEFLLVQKSFKGPVRTIDVRGLEMPEPMVKILAELESLPGGSALFVRHERVPQYLFPELEERHCSVIYSEDTPGIVNILIIKG